MQSQTLFLYNYGSVESYYTEKNDFDHIPTDIHIHKDTLANNSAIYLPFFLCVGQ